MIFTKALVLKVLGGLAVCTGVTVGGVKLLGGSGNNEQKEEKKNGTPNGQANPNPGSPGNLENPAGDRVNSNPSNQNNAQNLQQQPQTQENPPGSSAGDGVNSNPSNLNSAQNLQQQPQTQQVTTKAKTTITPPTADQLLKESGLGLECTADTTKADNGECSGIIDGKTINVKWESGTKREGITSLTIPSGAKIKYEKDKWDFNYNKNLKVTIEGGDIALTGGTPETITKLEEFETYEVKEEGSGESKKYYLSRKNKSFVGKSKALGLPDNCVLPEDEVEKTCTLTKEQLSDLNFEGKGVKNSVHGSDESSKLKILKTTDSDFSPGGYKFTLETENNITVSNNSNQTLYNIISNTEFKIKKEGGKLTLEKAWDISKLAAKVGLESCTTDECTFQANASVNVMNDNDNIEGTISEANKKIQFIKDQPNFNQGFKFQAISDIKLTVSTPESGEKKIGGTGFGGSPYEIKKIGDKWYLSKVSSK